MVSMVVLRFSIVFVCVFSMISMGFLRISIVFLWFSQVFPWFSNVFQGFPMFSYCFLTETFLGVCGPDPGFRVSFIKKRTPLWAHH